MLETKDYWTIGMSAIALLVSGGALTISVLNYRIAQRKEEREANAKRPVVEVSPPTCDGLGPWQFPIRIVNRDDVSIFIDRLLSDSNRTVSIHNADIYEVPLKELTDPSTLNHVNIRTQLPAKAELRFTCDVSAYRGQRVPTNASALFTLEYRTTEGFGEVQRLPIRIILNP